MSRKNIPRVESESNRGMICLSVCLSACLFISRGREKRKEVKRIKKSIVNPCIFSSRGIN